MFKRLIVLFGVLVLFPIWLQPQTNGGLTNDGVVKLAKSGFDDQTIVTFIEAQGGTFDLGVSSLVELKEQGVSERVIRAMLETKHAAEPSEEGATEAPPVSGHLPTEIGVYFSEQDLHEAIQIGARQKKKKGQGYGLQLKEGFRGSFMRGVSGVGATQSGYGASVYTPLAWVRQISASAVAEGRLLTVSDLTKDDRDPVLRVVAYPITRYSKNVEDIQLVRPGGGTVKAAWKTSYTVLDELKGMRAGFPLHDVLKLRNRRGKPEFTIFVWGAGGAYFARDGRKFNSWKIDRKKLTKLP